MKDGGPALQNEVLTIKEVAAFLRVSRVTVWRWCKEGVIPAFRIGRNWRVSREEILHFIAISQLSHAVSTNPNHNPNQPPENDHLTQTSEAVLEQKESAVEDTMMTLTAI
jgi:excisionase family DNA binding protein